MTVMNWPVGQDNAGWPTEPSAMMEPGRVRTWPRGTQVGANAAQRLLSRAVGWWDASFYTPGDRFLRNRGTGSELLDLRLGSSFVANSNDPEFLGVADVGYVWLSGVAGNSLSMTAPATATQFIAYPLNESVATTTGVASGGATFTFSTVGAWRKIELLDVANVVLDTIDCDAIATGATTSFQSVQNQTVTVNRSTGGRKSVAMPSRWNGGRACFLFGTDDYLECLDTWQHQMLNFSQNQSFSLLAVAREWPNAMDQRPYIRKDGGQQYALDTQGNHPIIDSRVEIAFPGRSTGGSFTYGDGQVLIGVLNRSSEVLRLNTNVSFAGTKGLGQVNPANSFFVGYNRSVNVFKTFEFTAAAVWRRALTADEIATISRHYTGA